MPRKKHDNPRRVIHNQKPHPRREKKRVAARIKFLRQIDMEKAIGTDPIFHHGSSSGRDQASAAWKKQAAKYVQSRDA